MRINRAIEKTQSRFMIDLAAGDCFIRTGEQFKDRVYLIVYDGKEFHSVDLYTGELLEVTMEIVTPVSATLEYRSWIE